MGDVMRGGCGRNTRASVLRFIQATYLFTRRSQRGGAPRAIAIVRCASSVPYVLTSGNVGFGIDLCMFSGSSYVCLIHCLCDHLGAGRRHVCKSSICMVFESPSCRIAYLGHTLDIIPRPRPSRICVDSSELCR